MVKDIRLAMWTRMAAMLALLILCSGPVCSAQDQNVTTVHAFGTGRIHGDDMSAGRDEAISASLVAAVTRVLTDIAPPDLVAGHFQDINESILARTDQFILDYKPMAEYIQGKELRVMVRATVSTARLKQALKKAGIYTGRQHYPRVLLCIAEKAADQTQFQFWWGGQRMGQAGPATRAMSERLELKGFSLIHPISISSRRGYAYQLSVPEAVALGEEMQADIVIIGTGVAEKPDETAGAAVPTFRGRLAARAFRVKDGQEIGQVEQVATATDPDPYAGGQAALEKAALLAGDGLASQMVSAWFSTDSGASKLEIRVEGISGKIYDFVKFRGALTTMSGVDGVQQKEMRADAAVLSVNFQGNRQALADALMRQHFDAFSVEIAGMDNNAIRLRLVPRQ
ncbi:MAG: hypothetical protein P8X96_22145 [Desulfobacteraceae bacterium]